MSMAGSSYAGSSDGGSSIGSHGGGESFDPDRHRLSDFINGVFFIRNWRGFGSEKCIETEPTGTREKIKLSLRRPRRDFGHQTKFTSFSGSKKEPLFFELASNPGHRVETVEMAELEAGVQASRKLRENCKCRAIWFIEHFCFCLSAIFQKRSIFWKSDLKHFFFKINGTPVFFHEQFSFLNHLELTSANQLKAPLKVQ